MTAPIALTIFGGPCGDRNPRGAEGAAFVGAELAERTGSIPTHIGDRQEPLAADWRVELEAARPGLRELAGEVDRILESGGVPITAMSRCAASLATLPKVARHRPDALIVWFDAHGDSNTPDTSSTGYLGGLVLTGASGRWESGLGNDLNLANVVLVGARDIDPAERELIDSGIIKLVPGGPDLALQLQKAVKGRPVYVHVDCDVMEPGLVPTEYEVKGGLTFDDLFEASKILAASAIIGLEIAEFEGDTDTKARGALLAALDPIIARAASTG
ncbi:MAG: arginase family protein [Sphingosinicella sp.]|nr:arginase family protein [Sphingosinicella sp.]